MATAKFSINESDQRQAERMLDQLAEEVRGPEITRALRAVGNKIKSTVRGMIPPPGYPGDKPEYKPLRDSVGVFIRRYRRGEVIAMVVGYRWPEGAHGQPLEAGHEKWLWGEPPVDGDPVVPYPYLQEAVDMNSVTISREIVNSARRSLARIKGNG